MYILDIYMLDDTFLYFGDVEMSKTVDDKDKIALLLSNLNFNAEELKTMYNKYNSSIKFKEYLGYHETLMSFINILYNYLKKLEVKIENKEDSYYNIKLRLDNITDNLHTLNSAIVRGNVSDLKRFL